MWCVNEAVFGLRNFPGDADSSGLLLDCTLQLYGLTGILLSVVSIHTTSKLSGNKARIGLVWEMYGPSLSHFVCKLLHDF